MYFKILSTLFYYLLYRIYRLFHAFAIFRIFYYNSICNMYVFLYVYELKNKLIRGRI